MKLIIIDDQPDMLFLLETIFTTKGFQIVGKSSLLDDAKQIIKSIDADVVLLDINLTENGFEGLEILSECKEFTRADIFIVSSVIKTEIMQACYALGAFYFVNKLVIINNPDVISIALANRIQQEALVSRFRLNETKIILDSLGNREIEVLKLKEYGLKHEQIADQMHIEKDSVRRTLTRAYSKIQKHPIGKFIKKFFT